MKLLLLIFCFNICSAQYKWTDYDTHVHVSGNLTSGIASAFYYKTHRNILSCLAASGIVSGIGLGKEFIYDGYLKRGTKSAKDMDGNMRGIIIYGGFSFAITNGIEKKQLTDSLMFQNLCQKDY